MKTIMITIIALFGLMLSAAEPAGDWPSIKMGSVELMAPTNPRNPVQVHFSDGSETWLVVNRSAAEFFLPDRTRVLSKYRPVVKEMPDGWFIISFKPK